MQRRSFNSILPLSLAGFIFTIPKSSAYTHAPYDVLNALQQWKTDLEIGLNQKHSNLAHNIVTPKQILSRRYRSDQSIYSFVNLNGTLIEVLPRKGQLFIKIHKR